MTRAMADPGMPQPNCNIKSKANQVATSQPAAVFQHPDADIIAPKPLIRAGKRFDMLLLPQQRHGFGDMDEYFYWRMVDYFSRHLLGEQETSVDIPKR